MNTCYISAPMQAIAACPAVKRWAMSSDSMVQSPAQSPGAAKRAAYTQLLVRLAAPPAIRRGTSQAPIHLDYPALGVETPTAQGEAILLFNEVARCLPVLTSVFRVVTVAERSHAVSGGETCISAGNPVTSFHLSGTATARPTKCVCTSAACPSHGRRVAVTLVERVIEVPEHVVLACDGGSEYRLAPPMSYVLNSPSRNMCTLRATVLRSELSGVPHFTALCLRGTGPAARWYHMNDAVVDRLDKASETCGFTALLSKLSLVRPQVCLAFYDVLPAAHSACCQPIGRPETELMQCGIWVSPPSRANLVSHTATAIVKALRTSHFREHITNTSSCLPETSPRMQVRVASLPPRVQAALHEVQSNVVRELRHYMPSVGRGFVPSESHVLWNDPARPLAQQVPHTDCACGPARCCTHSAFSILLAMDSDCGLVAWPQLVVTSDRRFLAGTSGTPRITARARHFAIPKGSWAVFRSELLHAGAEYPKHTPAYRLHIACDAKRCGVANPAPAVRRSSDGFTPWSAGELEAEFGFTMLPLPQQ